ncbi:UPF0193 protein EVG1 [Labrus mixtus]|uniref:UPF0193 protein EVG1 n=1 Tax=Labrus mixtus TaxID=508554 RepID=UPI0029BFCD65|nr:UPF0193 protein EVG1 [Labrus mixtus]XP_060907486.1 UPF0193 protein EVG1 [Labrus mixtus]
MDASAQTSSRVGGGLWNSPRSTQYSKETQDMLRLMMQESRLNNLQRKKINKCLENGAALPLTSDLKWSASPSQPKPCKSARKCLPGTSQKRSAELCRSGDNYTREKFRPGPTRDLEKEKRRLQSILETGQEEPKTPVNQNVPACESPEEVDRYQEVLDEIEDRRQFLEDMASLGKQKPYINIINSEISQRLRELELMDKEKRTEKEVMISERKEETAEQKPWT